MSDIADFLRARLHEDLTLARSVQDQAVAEGADQDAAAVRLARRTVAGAAAQQEIVEEWKRLGVASGTLREIEAGQALDETHTGLAWALLDVLKHLAAAHAEHPDYRAEWRP